MAENTAIVWCDHTFNPWVGCTKVSPGCDHCYAESWAKRSGKASGVTWGGERRRTSEANWRQPLKWNAQAEREGRRYRVFCASLADVFDNQVPAEWRADLFWLINQTPHLNWLLLTKRIGNAASMIRDAHVTIDPTGEWPLPLPNVWLGATVVNQDEADRDIPKLLALPARVRFLSIEPMLGPIDLCRCWLDGLAECGAGCECPPAGSRLHWVICGSESGRHARRDPAMVDWVRALKNQCTSAGVAFMWKQDAERGHKVSTPELDGQRWVEFPRLASES